LSLHKMVKRVYYPGLEDSADYELARRQIYGDYRVEQQERI
jgi:cystathionine beta-lyase/cystathionine gamma-synthase